MHKPPAWLAPLCLLAFAGLALAGALARERREVARLRRALAALQAQRQEDARRALQLDHDLRTPLGTMASALDLLAGAGAQDGELAAESREVMGRQLRRMTGLTETLRQFARELGR